MSTNWYICITNDMRNAKAAVRMTTGVFMSMMTALMLDDSNSSAQYL